MSFDEIIRAAGGPAVATVIAAFLGAIAPVTVWIHNRAKLRLQERADEQKLKLREQAQEHKIVTGYLDRALDPTVPLAIRQQLLRFLSTSAKDGRQLETWAASELKRVDAVVEGLDRGIVEAERELHAAKTAQAVKQAEARLAAAVKRKRSALEPAARPPPTAAALKAGLYSGSRSSLIGIDMQGQDLAGAALLSANLRGANFREANLADAHLGNADVRGADLSGAKLVRTWFAKSDCRAAKFCGADLSRANFNQACLEGADLTGALLDEANLQATYDDDTKWPDGFDPVAAGAVRADGKEPDRARVAAPVREAPQPAQDEDRISVNDDEPVERQVPRP